MGWYVLKADGEERPLEFESLKQWVAAGLVRRDTKVRSDQGEWVPAGAVEGLFPATTKPDDATPQSAAAMGRVVSRGSRIAGYGRLISRHPVRTVVILSGVVAAIAVAYWPSESVEFRSARWKTLGRVDDFLWLTTHAVPCGSSQTDVIRVLGRPSYKQCQTGPAEWCYVDANILIQRFDSLILFISDDKLVYVKARPVTTCRPTVRRVAFPRLPPTTPDEARQAFLALADPFMKAQPNNKVYESENGYWSGRIGLVVRRVPCRELLREMKEGFCAEPRPSITLHGRIENLQRDGECWEVYDPGYIYWLGGYIDATTGELLLLFAGPCSA